VTAGGSWDLGPALPEVPDVTECVEAIARHVVAEELLEVVIDHPFTSRSVEPPIAAVRDMRVVSVRRIGKRIAIEVEGGIFLVVHLMIAGRFAWTCPCARLRRRRACRHWYVGSFRR
jgi:formamidopyrimidine-DNA glycosylase